MWTDGRWALACFMRQTLMLSVAEITAIQRVNLLPLPVALAWEQHKFVAAAGWRLDRTAAERERLAKEWVEALAFGGLDERAAVALIGQVTAPPYASAMELVDVAEVPDDRTHRDAWRRSKNGGPIWIDEKIAQRIDEARMWARYEGCAA